MTRRAPADTATRRRVEHELQHPADPPRSRAAIAAEAGVSARTVSRWADALGIPPGEPWKTDAIRAATISATDRRRALRSDLADELLRVEARRLLDHIARSDRWTRTVAVGIGAGAQETVEIREDDAVIAKGLKDAHAALSSLLGRTLDIDRLDVAPDDDKADDTLARLFDGLAGAYHAITGRPITDHEPDDDPERDDGEEDTP